MGIRTVFKSGAGRSSPRGLYLMMRTHDVAGLMDHLDKVNYDHIPLIYQYLTELSEIGLHDKVISYGAIPRAIEAIRSEPLTHKKNALFLIYSLISHGRCDIVLANDDVIKVILKILDDKEEEDKEIDRGIAYCMSMLTSMGGAESFIYHGGIKKIAPFVRSDDNDTVLYSLYTLTTVSSMGYQMEILETKVNQYISYHMPESKEVEQLSQILLDDLYDWREESFILDEDNMEMIDQNQELIGIFDSYLRPDIKKARIEPRDGTLLGTDGKRIDTEHEKEMVIELKRRRIERFKAMKNRDNLTQKIIDREGGKDKKGHEIPKNRVVKQRVVKKKPEDADIAKKELEKRNMELKLQVERKIIDVISGSLDGMHANKAELIDEQGKETDHDKPPLEEPQPHQNQTA